jgi:hypothetical protein
MATDVEIELAAKAMRGSKAWPVVFGAGAAETLARAALEAIDLMRAQSEPVSDAAREMLAAAQAVINRWDTPAWKDAEPTAKAINKLRAAIAKATGQSRPYDAKEPLA